MSPWLLQFLLWLCFFSGFTTVPNRSRKRWPYNPRFASSQLAVWKMPFLCSSPGEPEAWAALRREKICPRNNLSEVAGAMVSLICKRSECYHVWPRLVGSTLGKPLVSRGCALMMMLKRKSSLFVTLHLSLANFFPLYWFLWSLYCFFNILLFKNNFCLQLAKLYK